MMCYNKYVCISRTEILFKQKFGVPPAVTSGAAYRKAILIYMRLMENNMRAVITVIGKDNVGILAKVSTICAEYNANVMDVTQSVLQDMFAMIMMVDISKMSSDFVVLGDKLKELGDTLGLSIHTMHEDIFNSMHRI